MSPSIHACPPCVSRGPRANQKAVQHFRQAGDPSRGKTSAVSKVPLGKRDLPRKAPGIAEVVQKRIAAGGACAKLAGKRRSRRTGDPGIATSWTPSLRFALLEGGHRGNLRCCRVARAAICAAVERPGRQFASDRRRHRGACRRETRRLLLDSQNGRLDLNGCPQERCARGPAATGRPRGGQGEKKWSSRPLSARRTVTFPPAAPRSPRRWGGERRGRGEGEKRRGGEEERGRRGEGASPCS